MLRETEIVIEAEGLDNGSRWLIVETPAYELEWFYIRALHALGTSGIEVTPSMANSGAVGLLFLSYQAFLGASLPELGKLKDEMMKTVFSVSSAGARVPFDPQFVRQVSTLKTLREAWLKHNTGFTLAELAEMLSSAMSAKRALQGSSSIDTSQE